MCPSPIIYARQRPITASHSSLYDMLTIISSRYQYGPFLFFVVAEVMSNYLTTDKLKNFFSTSGGPSEAWGLRPVAFGTSATWFWVCCVLSNVGGSEKSQLWVVVGGSEKNRLWCVATGMSGKRCHSKCSLFRVTTFCVNTCFQSFSTLISRIVHDAVLKFSPCCNKLLP